MEFQILTEKSPFCTHTHGVGSNKIRFLVIGWDIQICIVVSTSKTFWQKLHQMPRPVQEINLSQSYTPWGGTNLKSLVSKSMKYPDVHRKVMLTSFCPYGAGVGIMYKNVFLSKNCMICPGLQRKSYVSEYVTSSGRRFARKLCAIPARRGFAFGLHTIPSKIVINGDGTVKRLYGIAWNLIWFRVCVGVMHTLFLNGAAQIFLWK